MKYLLLTFSLLSGFATFSQRYFGAVFSPASYFGGKITWNDAQSAYAGNAMLDTLNLSNGFYTQSSDDILMLSGGLQLRVKPQDSTARMHNWTRTFTLQYGSLNHTWLTATRETVYDANMPYVTIFQGDTTTYFVDSVQNERYSISSWSRCLHFSYAMMIGFPSEHGRRAVWDAGFRTGVTVGLTDRSMIRSFETNYRDSLGGFYAVEAYTLSTQSEYLGRSATIFGSADVIAGFIMPFTRDSNWWLSFHMIVGAGVLSDLERLTLRANFGCNFAIIRRLGA